MIQNLFFLVVWGFQNFKALTRFPKGTPTLLHKKMKISKFRDDPKVPNLAARTASEIQNVVKTSNRRGGFVVERLPRMWEISVRSPVGTDLSR